MQNTKTEESPNRPRWDYLYQMASVKKQERESLFEQRKQQEDKMDPECTFKPELVAQQVLENQKSFLERQQEWLKQRKQKIECKRESNMDKDLDGCTFQPKISEIIKPEPQTNEMKGLKTYVERQKMARKLREEKEYMLNNPYSHLSGEKKGQNDKKHPITNYYETQKHAERVEFQKDNNSDEKMQLGTAMKILHSQLYNINFNTEFN